MEKRRILLLPFFIPPQPFPKRPSHLVSAPNTTPESCTSSISLFVDYLSENTPYQFEIKLSRVYQDTIDRLGSGESSKSGTDQGMDQVNEGD